MNNFDRAMNALDEKFGFLASTNQIVSSINEGEKVNIYKVGILFSLSSLCQWLKYSSAGDRF